MNWFSNLFRRGWCAGQPSNFERMIMTIVTDLTDAAAKISADVDSTKAAYATALAAKDATIADLQAQLAALQGDAQAITDATKVITDADVRLTAV